VRVVGLAAELGKQRADARAGCCNSVVIVRYRFRTCPGALSAAGSIR
jgi:hypothetical protein